MAPLAVCDRYNRGGAIVIPWPRAIKRCLYLFTALGLQHYIFVMVVD